VKGPSGESITRTGSVSPEQFARVRAIFEAALERPARDRAAYVDGACGGDEALRREVEAMLAADATGIPLLDRHAPAHSSSAPEEGRFPAGTTLAGRYRILGRVGQGGMGEVYRAHDLILSQTVALKFLAPAHIGDAALARFRNEVRIARQVSHPNVCRVYDLGMIEGLHFLSMEYIDGEDLSSLLRRIGRLPQDKAIEFARKICAGLGAAHERGVLHRDLKPANIMIDGRGQPRITDFGLSGLAAEIPLSDLRSGTPAYMSPEQKAGREVTVRSDIYALGLVLHEMFTGKPRTETPTNPSDLVKDLDPAIERVILRCVEEEPKRRPSSALSVAMALPGGDPIAAALAAGETPSPEMVAASQEKEGLSDRAAILCFVAAIGLLIAMTYFTHARLLTRAPLPLPGDALAFRAEQILGELGYAQRHSYSDYGFDCCDAANFRHVAGQPADSRDAIAATHQPAIARFRFESNQRPFRSTLRVIVPASSTADEPGMRRVTLDAMGRLIGLEVRPEAGAAASGPADESVLFTAARFDRGHFTEEMPRLVPSMAFDTHRAWRGSYAEGRPESVRVEAAWWKGRPVFFDVNGDWHQQDAAQENTVPAAFFYVMVVVVLSSAVSGLFVAWHNLRLGRGDRRGAWFVAMIGLVCFGGAAVVGSPALVEREAGFSLLMRLGFASFVAGLLWLQYIAIEPYVRRQWPDSLISWTRLRSGRIRDPLVASHVLVALAVMPAAELVAETIMRFGTDIWVLLGPSGPMLAFNGIGSLASVRLAGIGGAVAFCMLFLVLLVVSRLVLRQPLLAGLAVCVIGGTSGLYAFTGPLGVLVNTLFMAVGLMLLRQFGLLSFLVAFWVVRAIDFPASLDAWYSGRFVFELAIPLAMAAWALWVILSERRQTSSFDVVADSR
jgi:serine/threonine-protein kinase